MSDEHRHRCEVPHVVALSVGVPRKAATVVLTRQADDSVSLRFMGADGALLAAHTVGADYWQALADGL